MSTPDLFGFQPPAKVSKTRVPPTGEQLRDKGIEQAVDHANDVIEAWSTRALEHVRQYALTHSEVMSERVRAVVEPAGFELPPDKRAWGGVMRAAAARGFIVWDRYTRADDPKVHKNPVSSWRSLIVRP